MMGRGPRGLGRGRGDFGRRKGSIICYNCGKLEHLAIDCPNPCSTCTYCRALDHATKDCP